MPKRRVITIHGINDDGTWQLEVEKVLRPHFTPVIISYPQYRHQGAAWLMVEAGTIFAPLIAAFASNAIGLGWIFGLAAGVVIGIVIVAICRARRRKAVETVKLQIDRTLLSGTRSHVIAHSFGSYILGHSLKKFPDFRFDRVILIGCVLRRTFEWQRLKQLNPDSFRQVRNEITRHDVVSRLASLLRLAIHLFGDSGVFGFIGSSSAIHNVDSPNLRCQDCQDATKRQTVLVHNVKCGELGHTDHFIGHHHAAAYWLPFLWGIDPAEYKEFMEFCELALHCHEENDPRLRIVEEEFLASDWLWAQTSFQEYILNTLTYRMPSNMGPPRVLVPSVLANIWRLVADAVRARDHYVNSGETGGELELKQRNLDPRVAVTNAIGAVLRN